MEFSQDKLLSIKHFIYRHARPIELTLWKYHFEGGSKDDVIKVLNSYQNVDGGFGHALEADNLNPNSTPLTTWAATEILFDLDLKGDHPMIKGILRYLQNTPDFNNGYYFATVPSNDHYPHAPWWTHSEEVIKNWGYNPTIALVGFILTHADLDSSLYNQSLIITQEAIRSFIEHGAKDMHELSCFSRFYDYFSLSKAKEAFDIKAIEKRLHTQVNRMITRDIESWKTSYVCLPSRFISSKESIFYASNKDVVQHEVEHLLSTLDPEGFWNIPWTWGMYQEAWTISHLWWKGNTIIKNMLFLKEFSNFYV